MKRFLFFSFIVLSSTAVFSSEQDPSMDLGTVQDELGYIDQEVQREVLIDLLDLLLQIRHDVNRQAAELEGMQIEMASIRNDLNQLPVPDENDV